MRSVFVILGGACVVSVLACCAGPGPEPGSGPMAAAGVVDAPAGKPPTPKEVARRMQEAFTSTPVLHVTVLNKHRGVDFECQGWMMGRKSLTHVRQGGKLIFAQSIDERRIQEYVPKVTLANGTEAERVVMEYDAGGPSDTWPRMKDADFGCGPAIVAAGAYLPGPYETYAELHLQNMQQSTMSETTLFGRACYWYQMKATITDDSIDWNLYVDKETFTPLRQSRLILSSSGATLKEDVFDYTFEHLPSDDGISWGLDADRLGD